MNNMNPKVDDFLNRAEQWKEEFQELRMIILSTGLSEELKWGQPCYTHDGNNIVLIHGFNDYCAILFHKGALLDDPDGVLIQQTENTQAARQIRFTDVQQIVDMESTIKAYVDNAIEVEKEGLEVEYKDTSEFDFPEELRNKFDEDPAFKAAFEALTPGRQRGYLLYFSGAKQSKTRTSRIERYRQNIFDGKGLNDR